MDSDITVYDTITPEELAEILGNFSSKYAARTGDYEMATNFIAAAKMLIDLSELRAADAA